MAFLIFVIFAFMISQTSRAFKCFLTIWTIVINWIITVMIPYVDFQVSLVLQNFLAIRTLVFFYLIILVSWNRTRVECQKVTYFHRESLAVSFFYDTKICDFSNLH